MNSAVSNSEAALPRVTLMMLAVMCGLSVASAYYVQPLLPTIGRAFHISDASIGILPMLTQIGIAFGIVLFVPLGDIVDERKLIVALALAQVLALVLIGASQSVGMLRGSSALLGLTTVTPYLLPPFAAKLTPADQRGHVTGIIARGLFGGVLLARTASGYVGYYVSWNAIYWFAALGMLGMSVLFYRMTRGTRPNTQLTYRGLLGSLWPVFMQQRDVRRAMLSQGLLFGAFNVLWVTLAFYLESPLFRLPSYVAGLFGVIGLGGTLAAPLVGKLADRRGPIFAVRLGTGIMLAAWLVFVLLSHALWGLVIGVILLDLGGTASHVSNQARIYRLGREIGSRVTTLYMLGAFAGAAVFSPLSTVVWAHWAWLGVCALGGGATIIAFAVCWLPDRQRTPHASSVRQDAR
ncbi:MFS transporter [Paraburkholderia solisilvae]|uniref:Putative transporter n=1 Tax=Paraburkholderia solisilvae TaxID=624376 RepID=A0A6J5D5T3_9BURK|nr:MFS transporter [Paraburkholderia solisilvae]CAB3748787.1 putative transporter [Paraburkholderia solisilvae]